MTLEAGHKGYVAGVLDCDGAIWISADHSRQSARYMMRVSVSNTRRGLLDFFAEHFGGRVNRYKKHSHKWKDEYRWAVNGLPAAEILNSCLPYLVIKRPQAMLALEFATTIQPGQTRIPDSFRQMRERIYREMLELNKRGPK